MTGYSVTAVSRALKDAPDISEQTKERVRLVANQIGYRPNVMEGIEGTHPRLTLPRVHSGNHSQPPVLWLDRPTTM